MNFETAEGSQTSDSGGSDVFVLTLQLDLAPLHVSTPSVPVGENAGFDDALGVSAVSGGEVYVTGGFASSELDFGNSVVLENDAARDLFVARFSVNTDGEIVAHSALGISTSIGGGTDGGMAIVCDGSIVFVTGYFTGEVEVSNATLEGTGGLDVFVLAIDWDAGMEVIWFGEGGDLLNDPTDEIGTGIAVTTQNEVIVTGTFAGSVFASRLGTEGQTVDNFGGTDVFVWYLDGSTGETLKLFGAGGDSDDFALGAGSGQSGDGVIVGIVSKPSSGDVTFGTQTITGSAITDVDGFVAKTEE